MINSTQLLTDQRPQFPLFMPIECGGYEEDYESDDTYEDFEGGDDTYDYDDSDSKDYDDSDDDEYEESFDDVEVDYESGDEP